jgi:hypothetical protein
MYRRILFYRLALGLLASVILDPTARAQDNTAKDAPITPAQSYVGKMPNAPGDAKIGVVVQGKQLLAYVCSSDETFNAGHTRWFRGALADNGSFQAEVDGVKLEAKVGLNGVEGKLTGTDQKPIAFSAAMVKPGGCGGVYRAEAILGEEHFVAGWVREEDGAAVGDSKIKNLKTALKPVPSGTTNVPPTTKVTRPNDARQLEGQRINDLRSPLAGQLIGATVTKIDEKNNQFTVKTDDGQILVLPADRLSVLNDDGTRSPATLRSFQLGFHFHISIHRDSSGRIDGIDVSLTVTTKKQATAP